MNSNTFTGALITSMQRWYDQTIGANSAFIHAVARKSFSAKLRVRNYRKLASLLENGVQLQVALTNLQQRAAKRGRTDIESVILSGIAQQLRGGRTFAASVSDYVPVVESMIIESGETAGTLPHSLRLCQELIQGKERMRNSVIGAVIQPAIMLVVLVVGLFVLGRYVVPKLAMLLDPSRWSGAAQGLHVMAEMVQSPWFVVFLVFALIAVITSFVSLPVWRGNIRSFFDRVPPWSFYRLLVGSGWLMALAALLNSGTSLNDSMRRMRHTAQRDKWFHERLNKTLYYLNHGHNLGDALDRTNTGFPDRELVDDLIVYADLPNFDKTLYSLGREWMEEGVAKVETQAKALNQTMFFLLAIFIGLFAMGVISIQTQLGSYFSQMGGF